MDLGTPLTLLDKLKEAVGAYIADNADFSGQYSVNIGEVTAPLKLGVSVWWENSFNGELPKTRPWTLKPVLPYLAQHCKTCSPVCQLSSRYSPAC